MTESLNVARAKLTSVLEIYAPPAHAGRTNAIAVMEATLVEFEAAVREDESGKHADAVAMSQAAAIDAGATAHGDRVAAEAALRGAAEAQKAGPVSFEGAVPPSVAVRPPVVEDQPTVAAEHVTQVTAPAPVVPTAPPPLDGQTGKQAEGRKPLHRK